MPDLKPGATGVVRVAPGEHACLTYSDQEERLDLLAAFVRHGLRRGEQVLCWTDAQPPEEFAGQLAARSVRGGAAMRRGQLRITPMDDSVAVTGADSAETLAEQLATQVERATRDGYLGLRVTADLSWAAGPRAAPERLVTIEKEVAERSTTSPLCVLCQYDRDRFDPVTLAFAADIHDKALAAAVYHDTPLLRICRQYSPPGVRVAGELDYQHLAALERALAESRRLDRHLYVNLVGLEFIDAACATAILRTASHLAPSRRLVVTCRSAVAKVFNLVGSGGVAQLRLHQINDRH